MSEERYLEEEAEVESGEEGTSYESEDEKLKGEWLGHEDDDIEQEESEIGDDRPARKRRKKVDDRLEDEDYDLIRENTGINVPKNKFRRIHMFDSDEEEDTGKDVRPIQSEIQKDKIIRPATPLDEVFGGSDDEDEGKDDIESTGRNSSLKDPFLDDDIIEKTGQSDRRYSDDMDDFIVGDDGRPIRQARNGVFTEPALLEALDVFGDFDPSEFGLGPDDDDDEEEKEEGESGLIEGEDDDGYSQGRKRKKTTKNSIYDVYEPSELERGHFTEFDSVVRITDVPERFQLRTIPVQNSEEGELEKEADWIYHQAFCNPPISRQPHYGSKYGQRAGISINMKPPSAIPKIKEALNFLRNHFFEVPYISVYRQEYIETELDKYDLWKILKWDEKWMQLQQRKHNLHRLFKRMQEWQFEKVKEEPGKVLTEDYRILEEEDLQRLDAVQTEDELGDVYTHFMLYYGRDLVAMKNKKASASKIPTEEDVEEEQVEDIKKEGASMKQARRRDFYSICQEAGLGSLASKFGLTAEQFGENLRDNYQRHETEQHPNEPEEAAQEFIQPSGYFTGVRSILQGACHMVALHIACDPLVRQALRQVFSTRAMVNVTPSKKGKKVIDESHPCFPSKYLKNKPVREFKGDDFLKLAQAEKDGLLNIKISIDMEMYIDKRNPSTVPVSTYFEEIRMLFYRDEFSMLVEKWNAQRAQAVAHALMKVLYPQMEKEIKSKLLQEAKEYVIESCVLQFRKWLESGPYPIGQMNDSIHESERGPRVMACAYSDDWNVSGYCCCLDGNGEVLEFLRLASVHKRRNAFNEVERVQKEEEIEKIKDIIAKRKPDIIVVSAESRQAFGIVDDFKSCISEIEFDDDTLVPVELMDPNVAGIYSKSSRAKEAYPSYPELLLLTISLGRRVQEPLHEFASLFLSHDDEVLALRMQVLQSEVPQDQLKQALEAELVSKINEVGVDINFCLEHSHAEPVISFLCGFGPRKASALSKIVRQESIQIQNRSQLVIQCSIGRQIFINCAGFIKINPSTFILSDSNSIEVLDNTRIHPETYAWATKMAVDALEYDDEVYNQTGDDSNPSAPVEDIMKKPDKLHDLDLDAFAVELQRRGCGNKRATLYSIRDELFVPFKDFRNPFGSMSLEEKFTLLTGETPDSLYEGKLVTCTVTGIVRRRPNQMARDRANPLKNQITGYLQCPFCLQSNFPDVSLVWSHIDDGSCPGQGIGVRTKLENGLSGFILTKNLSDKQVHVPEERVQVGMTIHCRILSVNLDKFSVDLTCRSSDLADKQGRFSIPRDIYFDHAAADVDRKKEEANQQKPKQKCIKRVIVHPSFMNVSFSEADKLLSSMDQGEAIFRPSSQGYDRLTLSWKVTDKVIQHISIKEEGKPNAYSLGKSLVIEDEEYEDLDEILARYVQPLAANAREITSHKTYREANGGDRKYLEKLLADEKARTPKRIPYFFSSAIQYPGKFVLAYQPSIRPKFEFVTLLPEGFRYRGQVQNSIGQLINWFKEHYKDPIRVSKPISQMRPQSVHGSSIHGTPLSGHIHHQPGQTPYTPSQWMYHTPPSVAAQWSYHPTPTTDD